MRQHFYVLFLCIFQFSFLAQDGGIDSWPRDDRKLFESGQSLFEDKLYGLAYDRFSELSKKHPQDLAVKYLTGICGIFISDKHDEAKNILNVVYAKDKKTVDIDFYFALLYHKTGEFDKSIEYANKLLAANKLKGDQYKVLKRTIENCNNAKELVEKPLSINIQNIGSPPNSMGAEYSAVVTSDEETIFFTYRGDKSTGGLRDSYGKENKLGYYFEDIFLSKKVNGKWQEATSLENVNTISHDAIISISNDGQRIFLFRVDEKDGGDIYESVLVGDKFSEPVKLKGEINSTSWEGSISLSSNQRMVIFASERAGGLGGKDLYSALKLADGSWGKVKNLGPTINTKEDEDAPFIHPDGRTLVFSSTGHNSMGGYDIFLSDLDEIDSTWKKPVNIGYPINTVDDDIYYVLSADGKRGYYASARPGGYGDKDIYVLEPAVSSKKSFLTIVKGKITQSLLPYGCEVSVYLANGKSFGLYRSNASSGNYLISLPSGYNYRLSYYHPILGERLFDVNTSLVDGYAEKEINVNFGDFDTIPKIKNIKVEPKDSVHIVIDPFDLAPVKQGRAAGTATFAPIDTTIISVDNHNHQITNTTAVNSKILNRDELLRSYGDLIINGVKYFVQVGAYRKPQNFKKQKLSSAGNVKQSGTILGDISLLIMDKEFDTWKEADAYLITVKNLGQTDAFLTALINGQRYYLKDLLERGVWEKKSP
ncbi:MAG: PD40 domain-containing protein [Bacteroidetes bacterium]|nr:PD40 domain-containing protein [Bacteroidota bacterium]